jgi:hypothetical protein
MNWPDDLSFDSRRQPDMMPGFIGAVNFPNNDSKVILLQLRGSLHPNIPQQLSSDT